MAKVKRSLSVLLRHRKIQEELAERVYREAQEKLQKTMDELSRIDDSVHQAFEMRRDEAPLALPIENFILGQGLRRVKKASEEAQHQKNVETEREILRQKAIDRKIIKNLIERQVHDWTLARRKKESKAQEELAQLRKRVKDDDDELI